MAVQEVDMSKCNRCGMCEFYCPMDVIRFDHEKKAPRIRYPEDCMLCGLCEDRCAENAITVTPEKYSPLMVSWR
jgi:NAD-dependent dihydropyrimidine dehydrogenase PreA subunit